MKQVILTLLLFAHMALLSQNPNPERIKVIYTEYHPSSQLASENENETSLADYVHSFQEEQGIVLGDIYKYPLTYDSNAYFFPLSKLSKEQRIDFISGRLTQMDRHQINSTIHRLLDRPKKLSQFLEGIPLENVVFSKWELPKETNDIELTPKQ